MLKRISPLLNADVLHALAAMGHGDDLVIADANFPADAIGRETTIGRSLRIDAPSGAVARAVLSLYPLDSFVDDAAARMQIVGRPDEIAPVQIEVQAEIDAAEGKSWPMIGIERYAFYERAKACFAIVATTDRRLYANVILAKGVIGADGKVIA